MTEAPPDPRAPAWWCELQREFARMLRTPLRSEQRRFEPDPRACPPELLHALAPGLQPAAAVTTSTAARLAVYQTQYWMRLFQAMQTAFLRVVHVIGPWRFNHLAQLHLVERPPSGADLDRCADGFHERLHRALERLARPRAPGYVVDETPVRALVSAAPGTDDPLDAELARIEAPLTMLDQALSMDEAQRRAMSTAFVRWAPPSFAVDGLARHRLRLAPSFGLVREDWELASLGFSRDVPSEPSEPARLRAPRHWVFSRASDGFGSRRIDPILARLLSRAVRQPLGEALDAVRSACTPPQRERLDQQLESWLRLASDAGWWIGLHDHREDDRSTHRSRPR